MSRRVSAFFGGSRWGLGARASALLTTIGAFLLAGALPATASAAPLDCTGNTIYAAQKSASGSGNGAVFGLATGTLGGGAVTATQLTTIPGGGNANALGATLGGTGLYAVDQSGQSGSTNVFGYDASTGTWTTYTGTAGQSNQFVAGAVNPANGIYYYASYSSGTSTTPGTGTVYGFDTRTNTAIPGVIATFDLPDGPGTAGQNGDIAFDRRGDLYVLASDGTTLGVGVIRPPIPSASSPSPPKLDMHVLSSTPTATSTTALPSTTSAGSTSSPATRPRGRPPLRPSIRITEVSSRARPRSARTPRGPRTSIWPPARCPRRSPRGPTSPGGSTPPTSSP